MTFLLNIFSSKREFLYITNIIKKEIEMSCLLKKNPLRRHDISDEFLRCADLFKLADQSKV